MNVSAILESAACNNLAQSLAHFVWQGVVISAVAIFALAFLRHRSAQIRYVVCAASLLLMLACVPATFTVLAGQDASATSHSARDRGQQDERLAAGPSPEVALLEKLERGLPSSSLKQSESAGSELDANAAASASGSADRADLSTGGAVIRSSSLQGKDRTSFGSITIAGAVSAAYLLGVLLMSGRLLAAAWGVQRLRRAADVVVQPHLTDSIRRAAHKLNMHRLPLIAFARRVSSPVVLGFLRPIVLLPVSASTGLSPDQFRAVVSHELAHIRRYDHLVLMLQRLVEAMLFFHPAIWIVSRRMQIERERACDDAVLAAGTGRLTYVQSLLRVAELRLLDRGKQADALAALTAVSDPSQLRRRIARLLGEPIEPALQLTRAGALAVLLLVGAALLSPVVLQSRAGQAEPQQTVEQPTSSPNQPGGRPQNGNPDQPDSKSADDDGPQVGKRKSKFKISKETTFVMGPLTKDGFVDYRAAINQHFSIGVTAENNAVVPLIRAIGPRPENSELPDEFFDRLGIKRLPDEGDYFTGLYEYTQRLAKNSNPPQDFDALWKDVEAQWSRTLDAPWQAKDFPVIDDWLNENEKPLAIVVEGTRRPRYYHPWVAIGDEPLYAQTLAMIQVQREVARKLAMRAMRRMGEGDLDGAWEDQMAMHRLARLLGQGPTLIEMLVGIAINSIACHDGRILAQHEKLTAEQARRMQKELASLRPIRAVDCVNFGERLSFLDIAQNLARHPGKEVEALQEMYEELSGSDGLPEKQVAALKKLTRTTPIRWDDVLRNANGWFDRLVAAMRKSGYEEREAALDSVFADLQRSAKLWTDLPEIAESFPMGIKDPEQWVSEHVANGLAMLLMPAVKACTQAETRSVSQIKATRLAFALAAYRLNHGEYPRKLDQLAPKYINAVPKDPLGNDIEFTSDPKGYTVRITDPTKIRDIVVSAPDRGDN